MADPAQEAIVAQILMSEVFHCPPSVYDEQDEADIEMHWAIREARRAEERKELQ